MYVVSTFLDPNFSLAAFPLEEKPIVLKKMNVLLLAAQTTIDEPNSINNKSSNKTSSAKNLNYTFYNDDKEKSLENEKTDKVSSSIEKFVKVVSGLKDQTYQYINPLDFWRTHEIVFPGLALIARKYLGVQASSASVERMFSIAGHIFSVKRRRLGIRFFTLLLILKLNEDLID